MLARSSSPLLWHFSERCEPLKGARIRADGDAAQGTGPCLILLLRRAAAPCIDMEPSASASLGRQSRGYLPSTGRSLPRCRVVGPAPLGDPRRSAYQSGLLLGLVSCAERLRQPSLFAQPLVPYLPADRPSCVGAALCVPGVVNPGMAHVNASPRMRWPYLQISHLGEVFPTGPGL